MTEYTWSGDRTYASKTNIRRQFWAAHPQHAGEYSQRRLHADYPPAVRGDFERWKGALLATGKMNQTLHDSASLQGK